MGSSSSARPRAALLVLVVAALAGAAQATTASAASAKPMIREGEQRYVPYLARLVLDPGTSEEAFDCSGSVIAPRLVLTAAHCVTNMASGAQLPASGFGVQTGSVNWHTATLTKVSEVLRDPEYVSNPEGDVEKTKDDSALLRLSAPVSVEQVRLATPSGFASAVYRGALLSVAGWGDTGPEQPAAETMQYLGGREVYETSLEYEAGHSNTSYFVVRWVNVYGHHEKELGGACHGDSGGPWIDAGGEEVGSTTSSNDECDIDVAQRMDVVDPWITQAWSEHEAPVLTSVSPSEALGSGGASIHLHGYGLSTVSAVHFGQADASEVQHVSPYEAIVAAPAGSGTVAVTATGDGGTSAQASGASLTYVPACAAGEYSASGYAPCQQAAIGYYVPASGATEQTPCPPEDTTAGAGSTSEAACVRYVISPSVLPQALPGQAYSQQLSVRGGKGPYELKRKSKLPKGLKLSKGGLVSGTVSKKAAAQPYTVQIEVRDSTKRAEVLRVSIAVG